MLAWLAGTSTGRNLLAVLAGCAAVLLVLNGWARGAVRRERDAVALDRAQAANRANERMNNADVGRGDAADDDRWLREFGRRNSGAGAGAPTGR